MVMPAFNSNFMGALGIDFFGKLPPE